MRPDGKREGLRQATAWLHTWAGLLLGWLMFAIFLSGTLSYFRHELTRWMRPALEAAGPAHAGTLALAERRLRELAPDAQTWTIRLPDAREPAVGLSWRTAARPGERSRFESRMMAPDTGELLEARASFGGGFFYRFHFELRSADKSRWILEGRWVVGIATMAMFVALLSGIVTHRRIFADFFTFRPGKAGARPWLDAHTVSGVLALPYHLLLTFSGLMIFHALYLPAGIAAAYGPGGKGYLEELAGASTPNAAAPATIMPPLALQQMLTDAQARAAGGRIERVTVRRPGGEVRVDIARHDGDRVRYPGSVLVYDGRHAEPLVQDAGGPLARTFGVLYGLHLARFADPGMRWMLFALGLLGSAMVASGLVLWRVKRQAHTGRGTRLVAALNIATIAGMPVAIAAYFWANRLIPAPLAGRIDLELLAFYGAWGACLCWALVQPRLAAWRGQLAVAGTALALLPLTAASRTAQHYASAMRGDPALLGVDAALCIAGLGLVALAWRLHARKALAPC